MSSLNQIKATKAACWIQTARFSGVALIKRRYLYLRKKAACKRGIAPFRAVSLIKRGDLPLRIPCLALALLFSGCATLTTTQSATDAIRDSKVIREVSSVRLVPLAKATADDPHAKIQVLQKMTGTETFERHYVEKRKLRHQFRAGLWLTGAAIAYGGYYLDNKTGYVRLGELTMGVGALVPLTAEIATAALPPIGDAWREESRALLAREVPGVGLAVKIDAGTKAWIDTTDKQGMLAIDLALLTDDVPSGEPMEISLTLADGSASTTYTVPSDIVNAWRVPAPVVVKTDINPVSAKVISRSTLAILDFEGIGISAQEARVLTNRLGTQMAQVERYQVIERGQMQQILQEQDFQLTGCTSNECAVEIGQLIGAQQMLAGSFGKLGTVYTIDMKIIDVETGKVLRTSSYDIEGSINLLLTEGLKEAVKKIVSTD